MSLREEWDRLPPSAFIGGGLVIREIQDDDDLWYAVAECALAPGQEELVNPAGFDIGRAYLNPADHIPCVICLEDGTRIGFIVFHMWLREMPIKLSTEADNLNAQRLYERVGFRRLDELDGDDLVFCLRRDTGREEERQT